MECLRLSLACLLSPFQRRIHDPERDALIPNDTSNNHPTFPPPNTVITRPETLQYRTRSSSTHLISGQTTPYTPGAPVSPELEIRPGGTRRASSREHQERINQISRNYSETSSALIFLSQKVQAVADPTKPSRMMSLRPSQQTSPNPDNTTPSRPGHRSTQSLQSVLPFSPKPGPVLPPKIQTHPLPTPKGLGLGLLDPSHHQHSALLGGDAQNMTSLHHKLDAKGSLLRLRRSIHHHPAVLPRSVSENDVKNISVTSIDGLKRIDSPVPQGERAGVSRNRRRAESNGILDQRPALPTLHQSESRNVNDKPRHADEQKSVSRGRTPERRLTASSKPEQPSRQPTLDLVKVNRALESANANAMQTQPTNAEVFEFLLFSSKAPFVPLPPSEPDTLDGSSILRAELQRDAAMVGAARHMGPGATSRSRSASYSQSRGRSPQLSHSRRGSVTGHLSRESPRTIERDRSGSISTRPSAQHSRIPSTGNIPGVSGDISPLALQIRQLPSSNDISGHITEESSPEAAPPIPSRPRGRSFAQIVQDNKAETQRNKEEYLGKAAVTRQEPTKTFATQDSPHIQIRTNQNRRNPTEGLGGKTKPQNIEQSENASAHSRTDPSKDTPIKQEPGVALERVSETRQTDERVRAWRTTIPVTTTSEESVLTRPGKLLPQLSAPVQKYDTPQESRAESSDERIFPMSPFEQSNEGPVPGQVERFKDIPHLKNITDSDSECSEDEANKDVAGGGQQITSDLYVGSQNQEHIVIGDTGLQALTPHRISAEGSPDCLQPLENSLPPAYHKDDDTPDPIPTAYRGRPRLQSETVSQYSHEEKNVALEEQEAPVIRKELGLKGLWGDTSNDFSAQPRPGRNQSRPGGSRSRGRGSKSRNGGRSRTSSGRAEGMTCDTPSQGKRKEIDGVLIFDETTNRDEDGRKRS